MDWRKQDTGFLGAAVGAAAVAACVVASSFGSSQGASPLVDRADIAGLPLPGVAPPPRRPRPLALPERIELVRVRVTTTPQESAPDAPPPSASPPVSPPPPALTPTPTPTSTRSEDDDDRTPERAATAKKARTSRGGASAPR